MTTAIIELGGHEAHVTFDYTPPTPDTREELGDVEEYSIEKIELRVAPGPTGWLDITDLIEEFDADYERIVEKLGKLHDE